jgi:threonine/homoserine/homoserine lactone efflux protein
VTRERAYRRLVRILPRAWRRQHEDELIGTLLDAGEPGRESVDPGEALALMRLAAVLRYRGLRPARPGRAALLAVVSATPLVLAVRLGLPAIPLAFLLTSVVAAAIPGTGVFYTVSSAIGGGLRRGVLAAFGCTLGVVPHLLAALLGLSGVLQVGAQVFEVLRYAGVAYLIFIGVSMIRDRAGELLVGGDTCSCEPAPAVLRRGVLLNLLNPKLTLFFFAFLPQFLGSSSRHHVGKLIVLGAIFMLITFAVFAVYAYVSALLRERVLGAPIARQWFQGVLGTLLIAIGVRLAVADR